MIECRDLVWRAGGFVLGPLTCSIEPGCTAIIGPNGSGKSSLLSLISGGLHPAEGMILINGTRQDRQPPRAMAGLVALAPQMLTPPPGLTLADFVTLGRYRFSGGWGYGMYASRTGRAAVRQALEEVSLGHKAGTELAVLSGGEQRLAILARALVQEAVWTLLDEPAGFLDYAHNAALHGLLSREKARGRNLVIVTHDADFAASIADRILCLRNGRIVYQGTGRDAARPDILRPIFETDFETTAEGRIIPSWPVNIQET